MLLLTRGLHLSKRQLVDVEGRLQTRQWDDDAGKRHWKPEVGIASLEVLSAATPRDRVYAPRFARRLSTALLRIRRDT